MVRGEIVGWPISGNRTAFIDNVRKTAAYSGTPIPGVGLPFKTWPVFYVTFKDESGRLIAAHNFPRKPNQQSPSSSQVAAFLEGL